jgi:hypothetical protein
MPEDPAELARQRRWAAARSSPLFYRNGAEVEALEILGELHRMGIDVIRRATAGTFPGWSVTPTRLWMIALKGDPAGCAIVEKLLPGTEIIRETGFSEP